MRDDGHLRTALRVWRDSLVDLGSSCRLLEVGAARGALVEITGPSPAELVRVLRQERVCAFDGTVPGHPGEGADRLTAAVLRRLRRTAELEHLDRGVAALHVAAGVLHWRDEEDAAYTSPAVLVPVTLELPARPGDRALIRSRDDDAVVNPALVVRLRELGVDLTAIEPAADDDLPRVWDLIAAAVAGRDGWRLDPAALLSCFTFHKEALHRDLLDNEARILRHPVVRALAVTDPAARSDVFDFTPVAPADVDRLAPAADAPLVLDADAVQRSCVAAATAGHSFVLDGPPGTGKSQTIANMIAGLLSAGKRVLFVSEKAAALEVVRTRLAGAGLDPYLLELHSHQAGRKEVAAALGAAWELAAVPSGPAPGGPPAGDRERLREAEDQLTGYATAVNEVRRPLGARLHDVCAAVADVPDCPAPALDPAALDASSMRRIGDAADRLARTWRAARADAFVWRHVTDPAPPGALLSRAQVTLDGLAGAVRRHAAVAEAFGVRQPDRAGVLAELLGHAARRPPEVRDEWLTAVTLRPVEEALTVLSRRLAVLREAEEAVRARAGVPSSALPAGIDVPDLPGDLPGLTATAAEELARRYAEDATGWASRQELLDRITDRLGLPRVTTFAELRTVAAIVELGGRPHRPEQFWFGPGVLATVSAGAATLRRCLEALAATEMRARAYFTEAILTLPLAQIAPRVADGRRGLRRFAAAGRRDRRTVAAFVVPGADVRGAMARLDTAVAWQRARWELAAAEGSYAMVLGRYWRGLATDFAALDEAVRLAAEAIRRSPPELLPAVGRYVATARPDPETIRLVSDARAAVERWQPAHPELAAGPIADAVAWLRSWVHPLSSAAQAVRAFGAATGRQLDHAEAACLARLRRAVTDAEAEIAADPQCQALLTGPEPDDRAPAAAVAWAAAVRRTVTGADQPLTAAQVAALHAARPDDTLPGLAAGWERDRAAIVAAFDPARHAEIAADLADHERAARLLGALRGDVTGPAEWFEHRAARAALDDLGLGPVADFCAGRDLPAEAVGPILRQAAHRAWADHVLGTDPRIRPVPGAGRDELVAEFRRLDRQRVGAAPAEIRARVSARSPADSAGARLIAREAAKTTGHLPVRELIARAGDVVQALKPCFLMSPLAVSQYLPPDVRFDVVIFDEASQVTPADAIPSVYRAEAFIAVGDERQLPPTSFFRPGPVVPDGATAATDVHDFQSVLELAKACGAFRRISLVWHYRSRHEALIAFANHAFYQGRLVTLPSAAGDGPDTGIELFAVPGVYRRSAGRNNPIEAERVAERVAHHFATRPGRSLGVVTFSVAQAEAVQRAVDRALGPDATRHPFGDGARLHGFFVKSLESVQGDERDVMIFSVGYGPDEGGRISANFGPLNRPNGRRRLNVAITRARERVEIVSSIRARDIPPSDNEGVRLLADYLDYAERRGRVSAPDAAAPVEPFAAALSATITSWGYQVRHRVGTSAWRVDLAVRHPGYDGEVYALGVQSDGAGYRASAAARDRDRLRDELLETLGWRLHRVWSAAWHSDRATEERRLRAAIEQAVAAPAGGQPPPPRVREAAAALTEAFPAGAAPPAVTPREAARPAR